MIMNKQNITNFLTTRFLLPSLAFNVAENKRFYSTSERSVVLVNNKSCSSRMNLFKGRGIPILIIS